MFCDECKYQADAIKAALGEKVRTLELQNNEYAGRCGSYAAMLDAANKAARDAETKLEVFRQKAFHAERLNGEYREALAGIADSYCDPSKESYHNEPKDHPRCLPCVAKLALMEKQLCDECRLPMSKASRERREKAEMRLRNRLNIRRGPQA